MRPEGLSVVIPCLNESETIERAVKAGLEGVRKSGLSGEVVVADNGSTDGSQEIATRAGALVVPVKIRGYGAALDTGIRAARYEYVVFGDADLSYPLEDANTLIEPLRRGEADAVLGSRLGGSIEDGAMPTLNRRIGTPVLSWLIRRIYALPTSDCNSGMRALRRSQYENLNLVCPGMEYASEMLIRMAGTRVRYREVPIGFRKDQRNRAPHLKRWRDGWRHLRFIVGNAPTTALITVPAFAGLALMLFSYLLSFGLLLGSVERIHFHSAFVAIALAMPLLMFASANIVVRVSMMADDAPRAGVVGWLMAASERATPFYVAAILYLFGAIEILRMAYEWSARDFQGLFEIGGVIRLMICTSLATILFSTDLAVGLVRLARPLRS